MPSYNNNPLNAFNQTPNFNHQFPFVSSQNIVSENNQLVIELTQLDSPTISTKDPQSQNSMASNNEDQEKNSYGQLCDEWNIDDKLFAPQVMNMGAPSSYYYSCPNLPLVDDDQNHLSQLLHCNPDL